MRETVPAVVRKASFLENQQQQDLNRDSSMQDRRLNHEKERLFPGWQRFVRVLWGLSVAALIGLAYWLADAPERWNRLVVIREGPVWIVEVVSRIVLPIASEFLIALALGFLAGASLAPSRTRISWVRFLFAFAVAFFFALIEAFGLRTVANGFPWLLPSVFSLLWLIVGCLWGSWLGASWIGSRSSFRWAFRQILLCVVVVGMGTGVFLWMCLSPDRSVAPPGRISTEQRRQLVERFKQNDPRELSPNETAEMTFTQEEINQLSNWGLSLLPGEHAAHIQLLSNKIEFAATIELPQTLLERRYVNFKIAGRPLVRESVLGFSLEELSLGDLKIPSGLLSLSGPLMVSDEWRHEATEPFFNSLAGVAVDEGVCSVTYRHFDLKDGFVSDALVGLGLVPDLQDGVATHVQHLIQVAQAEPDLSFTQCMEAAFRKAHERAADKSAADENGAAILALACVMGPEKIRKLIGKNLPEPPPEVRSRFRRVTLRGRRDWKKHFIISAALQVLSNNLVSLDIGVLKEELDADGGSGFSFGDLLADRAGTTFAERATESESAAVEMQRRISQRFAEADFIPDGLDLPEGLSDQQFQEQYGGVNGRRYKQLVDEIDRRIENAPGYRR